MKFDFISEFKKKIKENNYNWEVSALASTDGKYYSLGSDSKLIGRIFELISQNILKEIAEENGYILLPSPKQTVYPDFTFMKNEDDKEKIAVDIKTTYRNFKRNGEPSGYVFTLGSYASFMRDGKKNISFPYNEYAHHYVICFLYTRNEKANEGQVYNGSELDSIPVPYKDVKVFVQEKYKIAGEKPGSGNTENIGSFKTNRMDYLINGEGPFSELGLEVFEDYWSGYPEYRVKDKNYTNISEYIDFVESQGVDVSNLRRVYDFWKKRHNEL